jgi:hypothetical protein
MKTCQTRASATVAQVISQSSVLVEDGGETRLKDANPQTRFMGTLRSSSLRRRAEVHWNVRGASVGGPREPASLERLRETIIEHRKPLVLFVCMERKDINFEFAVLILQGSQLGLRSVNIAIQLGQLRRGLPVFF